ncbi:ectonucleoside triphosphate diphosphohydrolase 6-like isoform X1 [Polyodon spathula]|uniref:ectonucleoside triphosphate diphosphohydrolase 6-like isoform X1 n=1 Tax=Polyodon spathula TaxID=7913 RepID=UPI001B7EF947|nr:ectonucleoside triphosphate diphosphohydrolase 6-like isoform X1 [Polyodon spathula]XP_041108088.1 ectonucleoside triphosphate diphosphohydrolase 6-like isoform X1 [Polyodon spathula]
MRIPKLASAFLLVLCLIVYLTYVKKHTDILTTPDSKDLIQSRNGKDELCHSEAGDLNKSNSLYGIMFDAGSTGTRIHVFKFNKTPNEAPKLAHETFKAIKPGLSPYADDPEKCTAGIQELLNVAKENVPCDLWKSTPLVLKATAGLRLLPGEKAKHLLDKVKDIFQASPFLSREDCVSIMDGSDEGISAWITVNFLIGSLHGVEQNTVGMLDLGGGSTQITFSPQDEKTIQTSPIDYITSFQMFSSTFSLYSHSYLGLGLMSARLAIFGGLEGMPLEQGKTLVSPCLAPDYEEQWEHAEVVYTIKGQKAGEPIYESCYSKVEKMLYRKVKKAEEVKDMDFYAFSYYYDRAVDIGIIDEKTGGNVKVEDFEAAARKVCKSMEIDQGENPFLCLDLTYITALLQELGFPKDKVFKLARKINNVETSWALGATFHYIESLHKHRQRTCFHNNKEASC